jgi:hypothetical protein
MTKKQDNLDISRIIYGMKKKLLFQMGGMMHILKNKGKYAICIGLITILSTSIAFGLDYEAIVIAPGTTIRQEKAFDSKQLDKLSVGAKIVVKEISDDWYHIKVSEGSCEGWICSEDAVINDNLFKKNILLKLSFSLILFGIFGAYMGSKLALIIPSKLLRTYFGIFLLIMGIHGFCFKADEKE